MTATSLWAEDGSKRVKSEKTMMTPRSRLSFFAYSLPAFIIAASGLFAGCGGAKILPADAKTGNCPVCHMKVSAGDDWESEIVFKGGSKVMFESPADMLQFYLTPARYDVGEDQKRASNFERVLVTDYSTRRHIDARKASLIYKSKVDGPMGPDFIAFESAEAAGSFTKTNGGTIVTLNEVTEEMVRDLRK